MSFTAADSEMNERLTDLALDVLDIARNRLLVNLRYMDVALSFHGRADYDGSLCTDGKTLYFEPVYILKAYRDSKEALTRTYLHSVLHCIFQHPFIPGSIDRRLWDIACDIAAEATINELGLVCTATETDSRQQDAVRKIRRQTGFVTAEKIYHGLRKGLFSPADISAWEKLFCRDTHDIWYKDAASEADADGSVLLQLPATDLQTAAEWKDIAEQIMMDVEMFAKVRGKYASSLVQNLRAVTREHYDYADFLRKFAAPAERLRVSDDEFDYIYYSYGLRRYGNMPLIEPLEYREDNKIREFVIAVDTSGSVAGEEVEGFLQKTYDILKSREAFDEKVNIHIIQCDAKIQSDTVIRSPGDIGRYMENLEVRGLGGTDFRPVFEYVDSLIAGGELNELKGLIYFTDGLGTFPQAMPAYNTAFVFIERGYNIPEVPPWAIKVILDPAEI